MSREILDLVDKNDRVIGKDTRANIFKKGLWHRSTHVLVFNDQGKIFSAKRNPQKMVHPNLWGTMGEHPKKGEGYIKAAVRGMREELSVKTKPEEFELIKKTKYSFVLDKYYIRELVNLYLFRLNSTYRISREHTKHGFFTLKQLKKLKLTPTFLKALFYYYKYRKNLESLYHRFKQSNLALAVVWGGKIVYKSKKRGIKAILSLLKEDKSLLKNRIIFDKIMGRAAALLLVYAGAGEVRAVVGSKGAERVFRKYRIYHRFIKKVDKIYDLSGKKTCPLEKLANNKNPESFYKLAKDKI